MSIIDWMFAAATALCLVWLVMAVRIVAGDRRERRDWEQADSRREWREFVDAMRRLEDQDRDQGGDA